MFLDELPELPLSIQSKLLRLLQEGTYRSVGEDRFRRVSARIIASTNRDVEGLLSRNLLKPDLFYRLNGHRVRLSPLRETTELVESLAIEFARAAGLSGLSSGALRLMKSYPWPGNVRELEMFIRRVASGLSKGAWLEESLVAEYTAMSKAHGTSGPFGTPGRLSHARRDAEREALKQAIEQHRGNMSAAARSLSMSRQGLYKALKRTGLV